MLVSDTVSKRRSEVSVADATFDVGKKARGKRKSTFLSEVKMHVRRMLVILFNTLCGNIVFYVLIGALNRLLPNRPIRSIFLFYSVNEAYLRTMIYPWYAPIVKWRPGLGQIIMQRPHFCLSFGITANEKDYYDPANESKLIKLYRDVDRIRRIVGADQMTFSGVLPSVFVARGIMKEEDSIENKNTVKAVVKAVCRASRLESLSGNCPIAVLGSRGFIGRSVVSLLLSQGRDVYPIDISDNSRFPVHLAGQSLIVLNITKREALKEYIPLLWKEVILVNEVYPEPSEAELGMLRQRDIRCYHISGIAGKAIPKFLRAYRGAIPCCASYIPDDCFRVVLTKLV